MADVNVNVSAGGPPPQPYPQQQNVVVTAQPNVIVASPNVVALNTQPAICGNPIPVLEPTMGLIILILNILWPGLGTMIVGCVGRNVNCCSWFWIGMAQGVLAGCIIGWVWSILSGLQIYGVASQPRVAAVIA